jgi:nicotinamide-nucleotide amidase
MSDQESISMGIEEAAARLLDLCRARRMLVSTAESCTGGLVSATLTGIAGSSDVFDRGFVTYSNAAKEDMLGVKASTLRKYGAVSAETATEMVAGALAHSRADVAVAITGIAGPGGGSEDKPVGLVYLAAARRGQTPVVVERRYMDRSRADVREASAIDALSLMTELAAQDP